MDTIEIWAPAFNAEPYEVSSLGRVRRGARLLKPWVNSRGYLVIDVKERVKFRVHRLVYQSFCGPCGNLVVDHIDHDKTNNRLDNLQAITQAENIARAKAFGRCIGYTGPSARKTVTEDHRLEMAALLADGRSKADICRITGRSRSVVDRALKAELK